MAAFVMAPAISVHAGSEGDSHFGDRQVGKFGDPGVGHFGNPAAGYFDSNQLQKPAADAQTFGKVYDVKPPEESPYISLSAPIDSSPTTNPDSRKSVASKKQAGATNANDLER